MSEVLEGLLQRGLRWLRSLVPWTRVSPLTVSLVPTKSAAGAGQRHQTDNESGR